MGVPPGKNGKIPDLALENQDLCLRLSETETQRQKETH